MDFDSPHCVISIVSTEMNRILSIVLIICLSAAGYFFYNTYNVYMDLMTNPERQAGKSSRCLIWDSLTDTSDTSKSVIFNIEANDFKLLSRAFITDLIP